jgi:RNA recognition motif-containing protein
MGRKLYVGNLPYSATQQSLQDTFSQCGEVDSVNVITDRDTGNYGKKKSADPSEATA